MSWAEKNPSLCRCSEQIATASYEAGGTFNMKFAFNGAYTIAIDVEPILSWQRSGIGQYFSFWKKL
jgi:hypothetical protein